MHGLLLLWGLAVNNAVPQIRKILKHTRIIYINLNRNTVVIECTVGKVFTFSLSRMRPKSGRDIDHWFRQSSKIMMFKTVDNICTIITKLVCILLKCSLEIMRVVFGTCTTGSILHRCGTIATNLLNHFWVLLHDV